MPRTIRLHDTRTGQVLPVEPNADGLVRIYACGPTVYGRIHVGNARPYVVFSLLARLFVHEGYKVTFVANITDVNDKIYAAALTAGVGSDELAREMVSAYVADTDRLGLGRPDHEPKASETIGEIVELIKALIEGGHAYAVEGDVYFSVRSYPEYGELSHRDIDDLDQGEGVEGAELKRDPVDFALWKAHKPGEDTAWESPWGRGRPGWHIECSAMAEQLLGVDFEIHGGGSDLIFPHHENEAAQTCAARGAPLAKLWVHNGMVRLDQTKMSKSVGNIFLLHQALDAYGRDALIMYFCGGHYRQPVEFDDERLAEARARVERITEAGRCASGSSTRWRRTSTRRRPSRRCSSGCARPTARHPGPVPPTCAKCSACSRSTTCSTSSPSTPRPTWSSCPQRGSEPARPASGPRPTGSATRSAHTGGRSATDPTDPSCCLPLDKLAGLCKAPARESNCRVKL
jgi:cysteinyl-tRNA synthetase